MVIGGLPRTDRGDCQLPMPSARHLCSLTPTAHHVASVVAGAGCSRLGLVGTDRVAAGSNKRSEDEAE